MRGGYAGGCAQNCGSPLRGTPGVRASLVPGWAESAPGILLRALGFVVLLCMGTSGAWAQKAPPSAAQADSSARQRLLAQELVPQQPARYAWGRAAEALGQEADALYLRLALLDEWLLALEGQPAQAGRTIEAAITHGRGVDADDLQRRARRVWPSILKAHLRPQWDMDGPGAPLPSELDALGADIAQEGPGLWVHRAKDGRVRGLYLWLGVRNGLSEPVPLPEFALRLGRPGQPAAAPLMQCYLPRYSARQFVPPQSTQHYLCRTAEGGFGLPPSGVGWLAQMGEWFSQGATLQTELPQHDQALSRTVRILVQVDNPAVDDFLRGARESAEMQQQQQQRAQAAAAATATAGKKAADAAKASRRADAPLPRWLRLLAFCGGAAGVVLLYGLLAHHVSVAVASGVLWLGLAIPSAIYLRSIWTMGGTDGWGKLVAIVLSGAAIAAPFVGTLAAYTAYKLVVSAQARRKAILFLIGVIVVIVLNALERWLFW